MIGLVDLRLSCKRDRFFISPQHLLNQLLSYLRQEINSVRRLSQTLWITNHLDIQKHISNGKETIFIDSCPVVCDPWWKRLFPLLAHLPHPNSSPILFISPFRGVVTLEQMNQLSHRIPFGEKGSYAALERIDSNRNPIRFNILEGYNPKERLVAMQGAFKSLNFSSRVKKEYSMPLSKYAGSQFVPELYVINEAMILTTIENYMESDMELRPVFLSGKDRTSLPLLYRLPVFHFHKEAPLEI